MCVHDLITAFYAIDTFRTKAHDLRDYYGPGSQARLALDDALAALDRFGAATEWSPPRTQQPALHLVEAGA